MRSPEILYLEATNKIVYRTYYGDEKDPYHSDSELAWITSDSVGIAEFDGGYIYLDTHHVFTYLDILRKKLEELAERLNDEEDRKNAEKKS